MTISSENKIIAKPVFEAFGGKSTVSKYWDDNKVSSTDLLETLNKPYDGVTSYITIDNQIIQLGNQ